MLGDPRSRSKVWGAVDREIAKPGENPGQIVARWEFQPAAAGRERCAATFRRSKQKGGATGRAKPRNNRRCTRIGGGCAATTARAYCGGAASWWNAALRTATKPAVCDARICADTRTF